MVEKTQNDDAIEWDISAVELEEEEDHNYNYNDKDKLIVIEELEPEKEELSIVPHEVYSPAVLKLIWDRDFRIKLLNDMYELRAHLIYHKKENGNNDVINLEVLKGHNLNEMLVYLNKVIDMVICIRCKKMLIETSEQHFEREVLDLRKLLEKSDEAEDSAKVFDKNITNLNTNVEENKVKLAQIIKKVKDIKNMLEINISKLFDNREIKITGKINQL